MIVYVDWNVSESWRWKTSVRWSASNALAIIRLVRPSDSDFGVYIRCVTAIIRTTKVK